MHAPGSVYNTDKQLLFMAIADNLFAAAIGMAEISSKMTNRQEFRWTS